MKPCSLNEPSLEAARAVIAWLAAVSKSRGAATVITPVTAAIANKPSGVVWSPFEKV